MFAPDHRSTNLDPRLLNLELRTGVAVLGVAMAVAEMLLHAHADLPWRALLVIPFLVGFYGLFAGLTGVCSVSALWGRRLSIQGIEPVAATPERVSLRRSGLGVLLAVVVTSIVATAALAVAG